MSSFNPSSLPDLSGKVYIVTGGNAGIGREAIIHLVRKNAIIYMGCRSEKKGLEARKLILELVPNAVVNIMVMDHMNLKSVVSAVKEFNSKETKLHGLINNAGIMATPQETSADVRRFYLQFLSLIQFQILTWKQIGIRSTMANQLPFTLPPYTSSSPHPPFNRPSFSSWRSTNRKRHKHRPRTMDQANRHRFRRPQSRARRPMDSIRPIKTR